MYVVILDGQFCGLYSSHTDAHEFMKHHPHKSIYYCPCNSDDVSIWFKNHEGP